MVMYMVKTPSWPVDLLEALLDRIRDETGMSQSQLAALVPMDQSQISRWRGGHSRPRFESLVALGNALRSAHPGLGIGPEEFVAAGGYKTGPAENADFETATTSPPQSTAADAADAALNDQLAAHILTMLRQQEELMNEVRELRAQVDDLQGRPGEQDQGEPGNRASA